MSDPWATRESALDYKTDYEIDFPLLIDKHQQLAKRLKPLAKPIAYVFDTSGDLAYSGRIDNRFASIGVLRNNISKHELFDAIIAVADGGKPKVVKTEPVGCFYDEWKENQIDERG